MGLCLFSLILGRDDEKEQANDRMCCALGWHPLFLVHFHSAVRPFGKRRLRGFFLLLAHSPLFHTHTLLSPLSLFHIPPPLQQATMALRLAASPLAISRSSPRIVAALRASSSTHSRVYFHACTCKKHTYTHTQLPTSASTLFFYASEGNTHTRKYNHSAFDRFKKSRTT